MSTSEVSQAEFQSILRTMLADVPEAHGAVLASRTGNPLYGTLDPAVCSRLAVTAAAVLALSSRAAGVADLERVSDLSIRADRGHLLIYAVGDEGVLIVSTSADVKVGLLHVVAKRAIHSLHSLMSR